MDTRDWTGTRTFAWCQCGNGDWVLVERKFSLPSFASDAPTWYRHPRLDRGHKVGGPTVNQ